MDSWQPLQPRDALSSSPAAASGTWTRQFHEEPAACGLVCFRLRATRGGSRRGPSVARVTADTGLTATVSSASPGRAVAALRRLMQAARDACDFLPEMYDRLEID